MRQKRVRLMYDESDLVALELYFFVADIAIRDLVDSRERLRPAHSRAASREGTLLGGSGRGLLLA